MQGKDQPYVSNKAGLNRYVWNFSVNGPVRWNAGNDFSKGPENGPAVVPGDYSVRMTLSAHTYVQRFRVLADPRSQFTQADYQRTFNVAMRQMGYLSQVDAMLNNLDDLKKSMATALDAANEGEQHGVDGQTHGRFESTRCALRYAGGQHPRRRYPG